MTFSYDQFMGALCVFREARGASMQAKVAVWYTIMNRVNDPQKRWPRTVHDVVTQPWQFSSFNANDPNASQWPTERHPQDWAAWQDCLEAVSSSVGGDPTNGANFYESLPDDAKKPGWSDPSKIVAVIGPFRFYRL